ncbi:hypothetical protein OBBRIDRAFT_787792 [Obba rivulosa]|uniref:Uncharacterized protein n=1 Tax=Obba rivulosa TaxID=1052685 RepID=A0A8E2J6Q8_9APHY|nr:hypothetical protein OBBRIDRAFT_787792 [Obba rivulosa]
MPANYIGAQLPISAFFGKGSQSHRAQPSKGSSNPAVTSSKRKASDADELTIRPCKNKVRHKENSTSSSDTHTKATNSSRKPSDGVCLRKVQRPAGSTVVGEHKTVKTQRRDTRPQRRVSAPSIKPLSSDIIDLTGSSPTESNMMPLSPCAASNSDAYGGVTESVGSVMTPDSKQSARGNTHMLLTPPPTALPSKACIVPTVASSSSTTPPSGDILPQLISVADGTYSSPRPSHCRSKESLRVDEVSSIIPPSFASPIPINRSSRSKPLSKSNGCEDVVPSSQTQELHSPHANFFSDNLLPQERPSLRHTIRKRSRTVVPTSQSQERELQLPYTSGLPKSPVKHSSEEILVSAPRQLKAGVPWEARVENRIPVGHDAFSVSSSQSQIEQEILTDRSRSLDAVPPTMLRDSDVAEHVFQRHSLIHDGDATGATPSDQKLQTGHTRASNQRGQHPVHSVMSSPQQQRGFFSRPRLSHITYTATDVEEPSNKLYEVAENLGIRASVPESVTENPCHSLMGHGPRQSSSSRNDSAPRVLPILRSPSCRMASPPTQSPATPAMTRRAMPNSLNADVPAGHMAETDALSNLPGSQSNNDLRHEAAESQLDDISQPSSLPSLVWDFLEMFDETQAQP